MINIEAWVQLNQGMHVRRAPRCSHYSDDTFSWYNIFNQRYTQNNYALNFEKWTIDIEFDLLRMCELTLDEPGVDISVDITCLV